jgi:hypothetical protein
MVFIALPNWFVQIAFAWINVLLIVDGETNCGPTPAFNLIFATRTPVGGLVCGCGHGSVGVVADVQATPPTDPAGIENGTLLSGIGSTGAARGSTLAPMTGGPKSGVVTVGGAETAATPTSETRTCEPTMNV